MTTKDDGIQRSFETGATRDTAEGKLDFEGFLSPSVLHQYARYMNMNRLQSDGNLRDSDNWQKGIPIPVYMKSTYRHFFEMWYGHRRPGDRDDIEFMGAMCGLLFNVMGYIHEWLKNNDEIRFDDDEPTAEMAERIAKIQEAKRNAIKEEARNEYSKAFEEYVMKDMAHIVNDINETPDDSEPVCTCCPGDCDCGSTGRIYGFAMPTDLYVDGAVEDFDCIPDHLCKDSNDCPVCRQEEADDHYEDDCDCDLCRAERGDEEASDRLKEDVQNDDEPLAECGDCGEIYSENEDHCCNTEDEPCCTYDDTCCSDLWKCPGRECECEQEEVQPGEVPLPEWVTYSWEKPKQYDDVHDALLSIIDHVGEDNISGITVETIDEVDDPNCEGCRWFEIHPDSHPCDCCDEDYSNYSKE